jgi:hypothetical protein
MCPEEKGNLRPTCKSKTYINSFMDKLAQTPLKFQRVMVMDKRT